MTATYSVNGNPIDFCDLKNLQITRKDYIDYMESFKKSIIENNELFHQET